MAFPNLSKRISHTQFGRKLGFRQLHAPGSQRYDWVFFGTPEMFANGTALQAVDTPANINQIVSGYQWCAVAYTYAPHQSGAQTKFSKWSYQGNNYQYVLDLIQNLEDNKGCAPKKFVS